MTVPGTFRTAVEAKDLSAITRTLDPGIEFHSPVMVKPYLGRDSVIELLAVLSQRTNLAVGCYCENEERCHRSVLRELLRQAGARLG